MTEQGYPPRQPDHPGRGGRPRTQHEPRNSGWQTLDAFDGPAETESELPPWAIPGGIEPLRPVRRSTRTAEPPADPDLAEQEALPERESLPERPARLRRPGRSRAAAGRRRRSRRRLVTWGSAAAVVVVLIGVIYVLVQPSTPPSHFVTQLQKGELATVPNACKVISASALSDFLGGKSAKRVQISSGPTKSECTYQVDAKPIFRELDVTMQAYGPNLIAPGNGSATSYAIYTFGQARQGLVAPPKHTPQPPAKISPVPGLGSQALSALQIYHQGSVTDRDTVLVRYRNVVITASLWATASGGFGPVSIATLQSDTSQAARQLLATVQSTPTVS